MASRVPSADLQAARRYGRLVDPIAAQYKNPLTGGRLSGEALLLKLAKGESGFDATADSGKAHGTTQFTPGSRQTAISKFGVDPWRSKDEAYHAAALHLLGKINGSKGLEGYNPGSSSYPSYILNQAVGNVGGSLGSGGSPGGGGSTTTTTTAGAPGAPDLGAGSTAATDLVSSLLQARQPAAAPVSAPAAPSFSAQAVLPQGYVAPSGGSPQAPPDVSALLAAVRTAGVGPAQEAGQTTTATTSSAGGGGSQAGSGRYPTGTRGKIIGTPYTGTHTLGNWQSDNAVDIAVPVGTPMVALQGGTVVKVRHHPQDGGRFAGDQITIRGANGNEYFYAHGKADVKAGQRISKGESLGTTGSANGVAHLHFGQMKGDPRMHVR